MRPGSLIGPPYQLYQSITPGICPKVRWQGGVECAATRVRPSMSQRRRGGLPLDAMTTTLNDGNDNLAGEVSIEEGATPS
jgi:hypothetical protein